MVSIVPFIMHVYCVGAGVGVVAGVVVVAPPSGVVPGAGVVPSGAGAGACPGQLFLGTVPSANISVCLLQASLLASNPVCVQIVL